MSFADPQTVTISGTTTPLPRTKVEGDESEYWSADGLITLQAAHSINNRGRVRRMIRIEHSKLSADPYKPTENVRVSMSNHVVFDIPPVGYTPAEALAVWVGFKTQLSATSDLLISKLLAGEN